VAWGLTVLGAARRGKTTSLTSLCHGGLRFPPLEQPVVSDALVGAGRDVADVVADAVADHRNRDVHADIDPADIRIV
jgi:hypothetical protein